MALNPITIRNLGPEDAHILDRVKPGTFDTLDLSRAWALLATRVNELVVALDRGEVVGFVYGTMLMRPDKPTSFFVNEVGVHPDYRRQGIGTRLMQRMNDLATDRGCEGLWMMAEEDDQVVRAFCKALKGNESSAIRMYDWQI